MESYWLDICILLPLAWGLVRGLYKGLVLSIGSFIGLVLGIFVAYTYASELAGEMTKWFTLSYSVCYALAYFFIFIAVALVAFLVAKLIDKFLSIITLGWLNKLLGALFGVLKYAMVLSVLINLCEYAGNYVNIIPQDSKEKSFLYRPVKKLVPWVLPYIDEYAH